MDSEQVQDATDDRSDHSVEKSAEELFCARMCHEIPKVGCCSSEKTHHRRYFINFLIAVLSMGLCLSLNGIGAELPLLTIQAPEGLALSTHISLAMVLAFIGPALYALSHKSVYKSKIRNEFAWASSILILGTIAMGVFAFFHHVTTTINAVDHSVVIIIFGFIFSSVAGSRDILLLPYLRHFKEADLASYFIGEGLSGFIPSVVALIQGTGGEPVCSNNATNTTDELVPYVAPPNFSSKIFFLFVFALMVCSICAFGVMEYLRVNNSSQKEGAKFRRDLIPTRERVSSRKLLDCDIAKEIHTEIEDTDITVLTKTESVVTPGKNVSNSNKIFLCVLMWLNHLMSHGYLNSVQGYSSRPYGNTAYHLVANLSQLAGTVACAFAFWLPPLSSRGIAGIMSLVYVGSAYVTWLAISSPTPPWRETTFGVVLLIMNWMLVISCTAYAKLAITTVIWRETNEASLQQLNFASLSGSIASAALIFYLVNFTTIFTPYIPCELHR